MIMSVSSLTWLASIYMAIFLNYTFYRKSYEALLTMSEQPWKIILFFTFIFALNLIYFNLVCTKRFAKFWIILTILISSIIAYFIDSLTKAIDYEAVDKLIHIKWAEIVETFTFKQLLYFIILGIIPSVFFGKVRFKQNSFIVVSIEKISNIAIGVGLLWCLAEYYPKIVQEIELNHSAIRTYINPGYGMHSIHKYLKNNLTPEAFKSFSEYYLDKIKPPEVKTP